MLLYKRICSRIPDSVTAGFKSCTAASAWERRSIRLTLYKLLSAERHDNSSVILGSDKAVMLFRSNSCERLKPVCKMCCALFNCPFFHCVSNLIRYIDFKRLAIIQSFFQSLECFLWQTFFHYFLIEHHASKQFWYICRHLLTPIINIKQRRRCD